MFLSQLSINVPSTGYTCLEMVLKWQMLVCLANHRSFYIRSACHYLPVLASPFGEGYRLQAPVSYRQKKTCVHPSSYSVPHFKYQACSLIAKFNQFSSQHKRQTNTKFFHRLWVACLHLSLLRNSLWYLIKSSSAFSSLFSLFSCYKG